MTEQTTTLPQANADGIGVRLVKRGSAGVLTLMRPAARNALDAPMRATLAAAYAELPRDPIIYAAIVRSACPGVFSAGFDWGEIAALAGPQPEAARALIADALKLCWQHECFTKPTIALMDGLVSDSGFGIGLHGTHRVAADGFAFAVPETGLGLVPVGGVAHALARLRSSVGTYLALTGQPIGRDDAVRLGLVTHVVSASDFDAIEARLADADPVDEVLETLAASSGAGELAPLEPVIAHCFAAPTATEIIARLEAETGAHATWASQTAAGLRARSPLALAATLRLLGEAGALDLRGVLMLEHRVLCRLIFQPDFQAGVRAEADGNALRVWTPARFEEVSPALVSSFFADDPALVLALPERGGMQGRGGAAGPVAPARR